MFSSSLPLDGPPQFILLMLSMAFSAYTGQFLHRLHEAKRYKEVPPLLWALGFFILATTILFVRIGLTACPFRHLSIDLSIIVLLFLGHVAHVYASRGYYRHYYKKLIGSKTGLG